jgi:hypothetical protein
MSLDFKQLVASERKESNSIPAVLVINNEKVNVTFDFDTEKAKITKKGKEYYINFSGKTTIVLNGEKHDCRIGGNLFIK